MRSAQTFSKLFTLLDVSVMRLMTASSAAPPFPGAAASAFVAIFELYKKFSSDRLSLGKAQKTSGEPEGVKNLNKLKLLNYKLPPFPVR